MDVLSGGISFPEIILSIISSIAVVFITLPIHEFAHGFVATKLGDPTPRWQGRLTLNPMAHIDWWGAACILLFGVGWARPVQINARYFKNAKRGMAITALAGPLSNILLAFVFMILYGVFSLIMKLVNVSAVVIAITYIMFFLAYVAQMSVYLAVFNLIPVPPFDGSRILFAFLPERYYFKMMQYERYILIGILALVYTGVLDTPISLLSSAIFEAVTSLALLPFTLFV